jgi:F0F1-type ATP synthase delta subunit
MARELYYTRRHLTAEVVTATTLPPATASALKKQLKQIYAAQSVALRQTIDPDVVGGCKVRTPIGTWDATIRAGLLSLNNALRA